MADLTKRNFKLGVGSQLDYQLAYINPNFENKVISHIIGNYIDNSPFPLYLAIYGKKGEGKTFQSLRTCSKYRLSVYYISGAELCGSYEKDSISDIEENLNNALYKFQTEKEMSVFVIDDFHLSIASTEVGVGRTVNSQILTGFLMNLADKAKANKNSRIPFILLGNNFNNLYVPLTRDGRMDFYEWQPTLDEKISIVCSHFDDLIFQDGERQSLVRIVKQYKLQPISFFAEIKNDLLKDVVSRYLKECGHKDPRKILNQLNAVTLPNNMSLITEIRRHASERMISSQKNTHEERTGPYYV